MASPQTSQDFFPWNRTKNTLLVKDDIGYAKKSTFDLPQMGFIYGKPLKREAEGAKEGFFPKIIIILVSMSWNFHKNSPDQACDRDFMKLNKMAAT